MTDKQTKQAILGFTEFFKGITGNQDLEIPSDIAEKFGIEKQEPSGDLISRQAAIKSIEKRAKRIKNEDTLNGLAGAVGVLFDLPPVKPQYTDDEIQVEWELVEPQESFDTMDLLYEPQESEVSE